MSKDRKMSERGVGRVVSVEGEGGILSGKMLVVGG